MNTGTIGVQKDRYIDRNRKYNSRHNRTDDQIHLDNQLTKSRIYEYRSNRSDDKIHLDNHLDQHFPIFSPNWKI